MSEPAEVQIVFGACEGEVFFTVTLGAIVRFNKATQDWSKRLYYGPVVLRKFCDDDDRLILQVCNRLNIESFCITMNRNTDYHCNGSTLMFRANNGAVYGLIGKNQDIFRLKNKINAFFNPSVSSFVGNSGTQYKQAVNDALKAMLKLNTRDRPSSKTVLPRELSFVDVNNDGIDTKVFSPEKAICPERRVSLSVDENSMTNGCLQSRSESPILKSPETSYAGHGSPLPEPRMPTSSWLTKPKTVPISVYRSNIGKIEKKSPIKPLFTTFNSSTNSNIPSLMSGQALISPLPLMSQLPFNFSPKVAKHSQMPICTPPISLFPPSSIELPKHIASRVPFIQETPGPKIDPIMDLVQFSYKEGLRKGAQDVSNLAEDDWLKSFNLTSSEVFDALHQMLTQDSSFRIKLHDALMSSRTAKN